MFCLFRYLYLVPSQPLTFSNFAGFSDFGFVGSMGILSTLFSYMTFMASLLIILTRHFNYHIILSPTKFHLSKKIWQHPKVFITGSLILTIVSVIAAFNLKSFSKSLIVFLPIVIGLIWMIGIQGLFGIKNDLINVIAYPIIIGIGIDGSVHLYHRYMESKDIIVAMRNTGKAVTLAAATTAVAFGSLLLGKNKAIVGLGLLAIVGITMTYLSCIFAVPAVISIFKEKRKKHLPSK